MSDMTMCTFKCKRNCVRRINDPARGQALFVDDPRKGKRCPMFLRNPGNRDKNVIESITKALEAIRHEYDGILVEEEEIAIGRRWTGEVEVELKGKQSGDLYMTVLRRYIP